MDTQLAASVLFIVLLCVVVYVIGTKFQKPFQNRPIDNSPNAVKLCESFKVDDWKLTVDTESYGISLHKGLITKFVSTINNVDKSISLTIEYATTLDNDIIGFPALKVTTEWLSDEDKKYIAKYIKDNKIVHYLYYQDAKNYDKLVG